MYGLPPSLGGEGNPFTGVQPWGGAASGPKARTSGLLSVFEQDGAKR